MSERIDELMVKAGAKFEFLHGVRYDDFQYREFARLIIQECYTWVRENGGCPNNPDYQVLKEHFGVQ